MANIFLTSATGYIGEAVAAALQSRHTISALAYSEQPADKLQRSGIKVYRGDLKDTATYKDALKEADVVIHTAAVYGPDFAKYDTLTVDTILAALKGTGKTFIYTSGTWVLGDTGSVLADEKTPTNPIALVAFRAANEEKVVNAAKSGVHTIVIRPTIVFGNEKGIVGQWIKQARETGESTYVGNGDNYSSYIHIDDLAQLYVSAIESGAAGSIYHGSNGQPVKGRELAELVAKAAPVETKRGLTGDETREKYGPLAEAFSLNQHIDNTRAKLELGFSPKYLLNLETIGKKELVTTK